MVTNKGCIAKIEFSREALNFYEEWAEAFNEFKIFPLNIKYYKLVGKSTLRQTILN